MGTVTEIIEAVKNLGVEEKGEFLTRLSEVDFDDAWDRQMVADAQDGLLNPLWEQALKDIKVGRTRPLDESPQRRLASGVLIVRSLLKSKARHAKLINFGRRIPDILHFTSNAKAIIGRCESRAAGEHWPERKKTRFTGFGLDLTMSMSECLDPERD